ncbi:hypothetical protein GCM10008024_30740 [Allgaiera indica]|nr:hypothetical protein GCM10008024_30740 [Allgaiera indica]
MASGRHPPKVLGPDRERELVLGMCRDWAVSIRKAYGAIGFDRLTFRYKSRRADQAAVAERIREICETRVRYGCRRVHILLEREGWNINIKKIYRIYGELGLRLGNKNPKRRVKAKLRDDRAGAVGPNEVWVRDFVHDQLATGKKLRMSILTVVDTFSRLTSPSLTRATDTAARMRPRRWTAFAGRPAIRRPPGSTRAANSRPVTWTSGPFSVA